jgi:hypothetical protein
MAPSTLATVKMTCSIPQMAAREPRSTPL